MEIVKNVFKKISSRKEMLKLLFKNGLYPIESPDTPLKCAIAKLNVESVKLLIKSGADVNNFDIPPIFDAADNNDLVMVDLLLSLGADADAQTYFLRYRAIHAACQYHNEEMISLLIENGADVCVKDEEDNTPLSDMELGLQNEENKIKPAVMTVIEEFSKLSIENGVIFEKDMNLIQNNYMLREHF